MATGNTNFLTSSFVILTFRLFHIFYIILIYFNIDDVIEILDFGDDFPSPKIVEVDLKAIRKYLNDTDGDDKNEIIQGTYDFMFHF